MTFSIVAFDPSTGDLGVAVASKFLAVGAVVPYARAGVGAVATQAMANTSYGPRALDLLAGGLDPEKTLERLMADDLEAEIPGRQMGIVDALGRSATFSGPACHAWAGGRHGTAYAAQGNILAGPEVVDALAATFETARGDLADRLVATLQAGQDVGGDRRGQQSAALLVVRERAGYGGRNDRYVDLRVDDHSAPTVELARLLRLWRVYFQPPNQSELLPPSHELVSEIQSLLRIAQSGFWDVSTRFALRDWAGRENLEERLREDAIDPLVLQILRESRA